MECIPVYGVCAPRGVRKHSEYCNGLHFKNAMGRYLSTYPPTDGSIEISFAVKISRILFHEVDQSATEKAAARARLVAGGIGGAGLCLGTWLGENRKRPASARRKSPPRVGVMDGKSRKRIEAGGQVAALRIARHQVHEPFFPIRQETCRGVSRKARPADSFGKCNRRAAWIPQEKILSVRRLRVLCPADLCSLQERLSVVFNE